MNQIYSEFQRENTLHESLQLIRQTIKGVIGLSHEIDLFSEMVVAKKLEISINLEGLLKTKP